LARNTEIFQGAGLDWGSGFGVAAIAAARIKRVTRVLGIEVRPEKVELARENARLNNVAPKVTFVVGDSFAPAGEADRAELEKLRGKTDFILANPPASSTDDGFEFRRMIFRGAREFLAPRGLLLLNVAYEFGPERVDQLVAESPGFLPAGILASTDWVPFDLKRPEMLQRLTLYAQTEQNGGLQYTFPDPKSPENDNINAQAALAHFEQTGQSPWTKHVTLLFRFSP
ncbi:MAG TPA: methyltransferase, partial [Candidatus Nitrosotenuis sp.]|nr:methyltransferase [Candidatus Nitrosotenuis sp.]